MDPSLIPESDAAEQVAVRAHHQRLKHLGLWTTARRFSIGASSSVVVLDLLLPRLTPGDIEIDLDIDHTAVKLLIAHDAQIEDVELRRIGRGRVKDRTGTGSPAGRRIRLRGEMRSSEIRVHRGGVALLSLLPSHLRDVRRAHDSGRLEPLVSGGTEEGLR
jgi:hypothetical protein